MHVRLTQIDGKLPNIALMKLSEWHKRQGDTVHFTSSIERTLFENDYDRVYGSAIFAYSEERLARFRDKWPKAIVGGTGAGTTRTVEELIEEPVFEAYDYSIYPTFEPSIGFTQRGCRLKCKFCVVPTKEGKNVGLNKIESVWRGPGHPKKLHLLDNDFFGQPEWRERVQEIRDGGFKVCLNQGINVRLINEESAEALASLEYRDDQFKQRRLYTAWDNLGDEKIFFKGIDKLENAGIPCKNIMAYMLVGYDPKETFDTMYYRFQKMVDRGILPYPMVFDRTRQELRQFQRWVVTGLYRAFPFSKYQADYKPKKTSANLFDVIEVI
jgi:hypothetical protein